MRNFCMHGNVLTAGLADRAYVMPPGTMEHPLSVGRDRWMCFNTLSYRTLSQPHMSGHILAEPHFYHDHSGAHARVVNSADIDQFHLVHECTGVLFSSPEARRVKVQFPDVVTPRLIDTPSG